MLSLCKMTTIDQSVKGMECRRERRRRTAVPCPSCGGALDVTGQVGVCGSCELAWALSVAERLANERNG